MRQVKDYRPDTKSLSSGQVLQKPYNSYEARNVIIEMADAVAYDLLEKNLVTDQLVLTIGYDVESLIIPEIKKEYYGKIKIDHFGRKVPDHSHGTINLEFATDSATIITNKTAELYDRIVNRKLLIRRLTLSINRLISRSDAYKRRKPFQPDLFSDYELLIKQQSEEKAFLEKEHKRQETILNLRKKYGKNIVLRGINYAEGTTQKDRNNQIGGHKA